MDDEQTDYGYSPKIEGKKEKEKKDTPVQRLLSFIVWIDIFYNSQLFIFFYFIILIFIIN